VQVRNVSELRVQNWVWEKEQFFCEIPLATGAAEAERGHRRGTAQGTEAEALRRPLLLLLNRAVPVLLRTIRSSKKTKKKREECTALEIGERVKSLVDAGADLIAFETIPNKLEAQVYAELLVEEDIRIPAWFSFSCKDETHVVNGDPIQDCASIADSCSQVIVVGVNCTAPKFIDGLISSIKKGTSKPIILYPNSGESYIAETNQWEKLKVDLLEQSNHGNEGEEGKLPCELLCSQQKINFANWKCHAGNEGKVGELHFAGNETASKNWKLVQSEGNSRFSLRAIRKSDLAGLYFNREIEGKDWASCSSMMANQCPNGPYVDFWQNHGAVVLP
ncbi:hypothetical protein S83_047461, partial [Arachis hypogaea]